MGGGEAGRQARCSQVVGNALYCSESTCFLDRITFVCGANNPFFWNGQLFFLERRSLLFIQRVTLLFVRRIALKFVERLTLTVSTEFKAEVRICKSI